MAFSPSRIIGPKNSIRTFGKGAIVTFLTTSLLAQCLSVLPAAAAAKDKTQPGGTLLLPLTPKIDDGTGNTEAPLSSTWQSKANLGPLPSGPDDVYTPPAAPKKQTAKAPVTAPRSNPVQATKPIAPSLPAAPVVATPAPAVPANSSQTAPSGISAESGTADAVIVGTGDDNSDGSKVDDESLLKGTVQITADDTEYDQEKNTFLGTGNAVAIIAGQNSKLEADTILYDQNNNTIDARGNVKILRDGQLTTGSAFKFHVDSDEYLITNPDTELQGTCVVSRTARGTKDGLSFRNGNFTLPAPVHISNNAFWGPQSSAEQVAEITSHPDGYVPVKQSFKFTARKMIYERYKQDGSNLTVFGGRMKFDHFTLPLPKFTANVGGENSRVTLPVTAVIGNNMQVGGTNIGPQFNYAVGKTGAFAWAPLIQYGGRQLNGGTSTNNSSKFGLGAKISFTTDKATAHLAYGSVSNLLVADFKYKINKNDMFQSGINRFLNDGMFGVRRAHMIAELVDTHGTARIPYVSYLGFRTSAGWAQDTPGLTSLSGNQYSQLFNNNLKGKVSAYRLQEQITATTHPIFSFGDSKYGTQFNFFGGVAARAYSTGDHMLMGQVGPTLTTKLNKLRFQVGYAQSTVRGASPFVFDQFIQGNRSTFFNGDVKVAKWLTLGTALGYNLDAKMMYTKAITAAIGPDDFKFLLRRDTISGFNRVGFDLLYGAPVRFNNLVVKGSPDAGQLGGI